MQVNLRIEEDPQFREYVRNMIAGEVRHILRNELKGIVAGEVVKMRLLQPESSAMETIVKDLVKEKVAKSFNLNSMIRTEIREAILAPINEHLATIKKTMITQLSQL